MINIKSIRLHEAGLYSRHIARSLAYLCQLWTKRKLIWKSVDIKLCSERDYSIEMQTLVIDPVANV